MKAHILVVEDDAPMLETCLRLFERAGYNVTGVRSGGEAICRLQDSEDFNLVLADLKMPEMDGIELLEKIKESNEEIDVVIMTGYGTIPSAIEAMKKGAADYVTKPIENEELLACVNRVIRIRDLEKDVTRLRREVQNKFAFENIVGEAPSMLPVYEKMRAAADTTATVLIAGESGTGKELIARAIHFNGRRANGPFVPVNCAALPKELIESELFGHKRGAFTGAHKDSIGLFSRAHKGTILLDEITDMPPDLQAKMLRVLQEGKIKAVGSSIEESVDVRVIAATNEPVKQAIERGRLRDDLYYRLAVINIEVPPLRERKEDIPKMVNHFLSKSSTENSLLLREVEAEAWDALLNYDWPGNVRELENVIEGIRALRRAPRLRLVDLPEHIRKNARRTAPFSAREDVTVPSLKEAEREVIIRALDVAKGNKTKAANLLGISRKALYKKIQDFNIQQTEN